MSSLEKQLVALLLEARDIIDIFVETKESTKLIFKIDSVLDEVFSNDGNDSTSCDDCFT